MEHWQGNGAQTLVLWVFEANERARSFYEAMGWQPDGGRQLMTRRLRPPSRSDIDQGHRLNPRT